MRSAQPVEAGAGPLTGAPSGPRPVRLLWRLFTASDPGLSRLRAAGTTVITLLVALIALYGMVTLWGASFTSAVLGVLVAMIASFTVSDPQPVPRALSTAVLVPAAAASASMAAALSPHMVAADAGLVVVAVVAVFLRLLGPRGMGAGMIAFIAYFLTLFLQVTVAQLPVVIVSAAVGAVVSFLVHSLLQPRHPDRDLARMLSALGIRAAAVVEQLADGLDQGGLSRRERDRLRRRVARCGEAARMIEQRLDSAETQQLDPIDNDELSVRVFDLELAVERIVTAADPLLRDGELSPARRTEVVRALSAASARLQAGVDDEAAARLRQEVAGSAADGRDGTEETEDAAGHLLRALRALGDIWVQIAAPQPEQDDAEPDDARDREAEDDAEADAGHDSGDDTEDEDDNEDDNEDEDGVRSRLPQVARQAVQVGLAAALAVVVGELLSPSRWYWAVITAFVIFTGTSTRGETLSKGWQRVLGTLAGVGAGVVIAALVGGHTVVSLVLIVVCVFLAVYLMQVSSGLMIFFITTMLALLYGILGRFSVGLLVLRLEETAAGAAIGVLVSFLVFPSSTREAVRRGAKEFLTDLAEFLGDLGPTLTDGRRPRSRAQAQASELRESFDAVKSSARPLTQGLSGLAGRSEHRQTERVLGACEHHARMLARLADTTPTVAAPQLCQALLAALHQVQETVETLADAIETGLAGVAVRPADAAFDELARALDTTSGEEQRRLRVIGRHLQAIDEALCRLATERGARTAPAEPVG